MDTFPIVRRKDEAAYGVYRTKETILNLYDEMAQLPQLAVPAPKSPPRAESESDISSPPPSSSPRHDANAEELGGEGLYLVPDVSQWQTWLNPPPADASVAHPEK